MEERIIDDEYGRGIRLKKTKDGYVDVTDELATETGEESVEEVNFAFPVMDEDDEDLVGLSPQEAAIVKQRKAEAAQKRREEYEKLCAEGEELLETGSFHAAELKYEKALDLDGLAVVASVGYWRAKTSDFTDPDVLVDEYLEEGVDSMEYDLGLQATDAIREQFHEVFQHKVEQLEKEEAPLAEEVEGKQASRRAILKERVKNKTIWLAAGVIPFTIFLALTVTFAFKITSTSDNRFVLPTVIFGVLSFATFILSMSLLNSFINALRMYAKNERLSSTEEGDALVSLRKRKEIYEYLATLPVVVEEGDDNEDVDEAYEYEE